MTPDPATAELLDDAALRHVLGHFCSGVTVITADHDGQPVGFCCQSFASLSLQPPLVLFTAASDSQTLPRLRAAGMVAVNVLADDQEELARIFARRGGIDRFAGVGWRRGPQGVPLLHGALASMVCRLQAEYPGGDHVIAVAEVLSLQASPQRKPLLFFQSRYRILGD